MLIADGSWSRGDASLDSCVFFARGLRLHLMTTHELTFDSRFLCPFQANGRDSVILIALIEGHAAFRESLEAKRVELTHTVFRFRDDEYDRRHAQAPILRLGGARRRSIEIAMPADAVVMKARTAPTPEAFDALAEIMANRALTHDVRSKHVSISVAGTHAEGSPRSLLRIKRARPFPSPWSVVCQAMISLYSRSTRRVSGVLGALRHQPEAGTRDMVAFSPRFRARSHIPRVVKGLRIRARRCCSVRAM